MRYHVEIYKGGRCINVVAFATYEDAKRFIEKETQLSAQLTNYLMVSS